MSNFLAIATVTAALSETLQAAVGPDVPGANVTTLRPNGSESGTTLNVYLYQVTPNASLTNVDLPTRRPNGELMQRPQAALDLNYLLTFYGAEAQLEPQRLLGSAVRALHARPIMTREAIRQTIAKPSFAFLAESNLADAIELVKFTPLGLSLDELSKLWSVYFQTQYSLSVAYQATVVMIESEDSTHAALPVRARNIYVAPFRQPLIEDLRSTDAGQPVISSSTMIVKGNRLQGDITKIVVGGIDATANIVTASDNEIILTLPEGVRAGVQGLQVIHPYLIGTPAVEHTGVASNLAAFVLHPTITSITPASGEITVKLKPPVSQKQRASLLLNELSPPSTRAARAYSFDSAPHNRAADPPETDTLTFPIAGVPLGNYLARVRVDGADSPLQQGPDANPVYVGPTVTIE